MSVASLAKTAVERDTHERPARAGRTLKEPAEATDPDKIAESKVDILVSYLPTELITAYLTIGAAIIAAVTTEDDLEGLRWLMFWFFVVATPIAVWVAWSGKGRSRAKKKERKVPLLEMLGATVAFIAWAPAIPGSPFRIWEPFKDVYFVIIPVVAAFILGLLTVPTQRKRT
jgi:cation transport ATPase